MIDWLIDCYLFIRIPTIPSMTVISFRPIRKRMRTKKIARKSRHPLTAHRMQIDSPDTLIWNAGAAVVESALNPLLSRSSPKQNLLMKNTWIYFGFLILSNKSSWINPLEEPTRYLKMNPLLDSSLELWPMSLASLMATLKSIRLPKPPSICIWLFNITPIGLLVSARQPSASKLGVICRILNTRKLFQNAESIPRLELSWTTRSCLLGWVNLFVRGSNKKLLHLQLMMLSNT